MNAFNLNFCCGTSVYQDQRLPAPDRDVQMGRIEVAAAGNALAFNPFAHQGTKGTRLSS